MYLTEEVYQETNVRLLFSPGVYSVIARLEPRGEARSTAELYLTTKGEDRLHKHATVLEANTVTQTVLYTKTLSFSFAEIKLEMKPPGKFFVFFSSFLIVADTKFSVGVVL